MSDLKDPVEKTISLYRSLAVFFIWAAIGFAATPATAASALWVADENLQIDEYLPSQLHNNKHPKALTIPLGTVPFGVCFDAAKNLWVTTIDQNVLEFAAKDLKKLPHPPSPVATITSSSFKLINGCTFDPQGNLWLADAVNNSIDEISAQQLKAGTGTITPAVVITDSADSSLLEPSFVTFDKEGSLWADSRGSQLLSKYTASQLTSGGDKPAAVILQGGGSLSADPGQIAFDSQGNLWVAQFNANLADMFPKSILGASNNDTPSVVVIIQDFSEGAWGLAFKGSNLWVLNGFNGDIDEFVPKQLKTGGSLSPKAILSGAAKESSWQITFGPAFGK